MDRRTLGRALWTQFLLGQATMAGIITTFQDWMGLDGYAEYIQAAWIHVHWSIPAVLTLALIAFAAATTHRIKREFRQQR